MDPIRAARLRKRMLSALIYGVLAAVIIALDSSLGSPAVGFVVAFAASLICMAIWERAQQRP